MNRQIWNLSLIFAIVATTASRPVGATPASASIRSMVQAQCRAVGGISIGPLCACANPVNLRTVRDGKVARLIQAFSETCSGAEMPEELVQKSCEVAARGQELYANLSPNTKRLLDRLQRAGMLDMTLAGLMATAPTTAVLVEHRERLKATMDALANPRATAASAREQLMETLKAQAKEFVATNFVPDTVKEAVAQAQAVASEAGVDGEDLNRLRPSSGAAAPATGAPAPATSATHASTVPATSSPTPATSAGPETQAPGRNQGAGRTRLADTARAVLAEARARAGEVYRSSREQLATRMRETREQVASHAREVRSQAGAVFSHARENVGAMAGSALRGIGGTVWSTIKGFFKGGAFGIGIEVSAHFLGVDTSNFSIFEARAASASTMDDFFTRFPLAILENDTIQSPQHKCDQLKRSPAARASVVAAVVAIEEMQGFLAEPRLRSALETEAEFCTWCGTGFQWQSF